jgi:hypothetical protein
LVENLLLITNNNKRQNDDQENLIQQLHQFRCFYLNLNGFEILFHGIIKSNDSKKLVNSQISIFCFKTEMKSVVFFLTEPNRNAKDPHDET